MTQDEIIALAREADLDWHQGWILNVDAPNRFETFAKLVAAKERKNAWEAVNALIVKGYIGGNGVDPLAERNGIVLATNVLMKRIARGQA
jgi:hypothetical protein